MDPEKEATLDAARAELSAAEDEWQILEAETDAELARGRADGAAPAARSSRPALCSVAGGRGGRGRRAPGPAGAGDRCHPSWWNELQHSLDRAGIAVDGERVDRDELMRSPETWLDEAHEAADARRSRGVSVDAELAVLGDEPDAGRSRRSEAEAARAAVAAEVLTPEEDHTARLSAARAADEGRRGASAPHLEAEALVASVAAELAVATEAARIAADEASDAEAAVAEATDRGRAARRGGRPDRGGAAGARTDGGRGEASASGPLRARRSPGAACPRGGGGRGCPRRQPMPAWSKASASLQDLVVQRTEAQALVASLHDPAEAVDEDSIAEEIEWYLLARLAAQRAVCLGGSLPLLLDDALAGLDEDQLGHVLGRLERMADAVQVIVVSDDPLAASWALLAGQDRAAVVRPQPA